jgi:hypothetical protein
MDVPFKTQPLLLTHEILHAQNNKINNNIKFLQLYLPAQTDALLEMV